MQVMGSIRMRVLPVLLLFVLDVTAASAQKYEALIQVSGMHLHKVDQAPVNVGGIFSYNFRRMIAGDIEAAHAPGAAGDTIALAGIHLREHFHRTAVYIGDRSGIIHFTGDYFSARLHPRTHTIIEMGGGVEYDATARITVRIEAADAVIYYGSARFTNRPNPDALGTVHNFQPSIGIGLRF